MVTIIFEAHATTLDNENHLSSGHYDVELSPLCKKQAEELCERYANDDFAAVFCSDLRRAYETAQIAFLDRDIPIIKDARLRECDYGELTRYPAREVEEKRSGFIDTPFPKGESYQQCVDRMKSFLQDLLVNYDGKKVLIIGHRATQYGLEHWTNNLPLQKIVSAPWAWQPGWTYRLEKI
ncbi:MAG: histidine phosphatase family protein [Patescibacteria group bacterium]